jgi:hypothetical protein
MNRIKGGIGIAYFISENAALYLGLQAQPHRNYAINTPTSFAIGASWFFG